MILMIYIKMILMIWRIFWTNYSCFLPSNADKHTVKQLEPITEQEDNMTMWTITCRRISWRIAHISHDQRHTCEDGTRYRGQQYKRMFGKTVALELYKEKPLATRVLLTWSTIYRTSPNGGGVWSPKVSTIVCCHRTSETPTLWP